MKKTLLVLTLLAFAATGCTGSFNLTKKVYNFHRSQSDKWSDELCFLLVTLLPIYGFATFADAIVFNSIEFWTGSNPVVYNPNGQTKTVQRGKDEVLMSYNPGTDEVSFSAKNGASPIVLERTGQMVIAKDKKGNVLFTSVKNDSGDVAVYDKNQNLVKNYSSQDILAMREKYSK